MIKTKSYPWIIFIAGIIILSLSLPSEYQNFYNARFGLFVKTIFHHGLSFFNYQYNQPYPDYTTAVVFLSYISSLIIGKVSVFSNALPSIIVSSLILVFVYLIGALHSRKWGLYATILTFITYGFFTTANDLSPDKYITLITIISFYLVYSPRLAYNKKNLLFIPVLLILGFMFRGPIGLIIPAGVLCGFYLFSKRYKSLLLFSLVALILLLLCFLMLLIVAYHTGGEDFIARVLQMQMFNRFYFNLRDLGTLFIRYLPTLPLALVIIAFKKYNKPEKKLLIHLTVWAAIIFIGVGIVTIHKPRYFLPALPALALICAYLFKKKNANTVFFIMLSIVATYMLIKPFINYRHNVTTNFMKTVQAYNLPIVFYKIGPDEFDVQLVANAKKYFIPKFISTKDKLKQNTIVITYSKNYQEIKNKAKFIAKAKVKGRNITALVVKTQ